ncbi:MAG: lysostaphin resistance A-like protein [Myxococcaceae bacterium]
MNPDPRPLVPPQRLAWTALAAFLLASLGGLFVERLSPAVGVWFNEVFCLLGVTWALTRWSGRAPAAYVRLRWPGWPAVLFAGALSLANFFGLAAPINALSEHLAPQSWRDAVDLTHVIDGFSRLDLWLFALATVFAAALCEEFLFRGVVQQGLATAGAHPAEAISRTALIFALVHFNPVWFPALLELGLLFGVLFYRTGSLVPAMVAHATTNATSMGLYLLGRSEASQVGGEPTVAQIIGMAGMGIIALVMLLQLAKHVPSVWGRPQALPFERPRITLARAAAPWLVAASVSVLGWFLLDRRGVELGVADWRVELPVAREDEPADVRSARANLKALRDSVRSGKAPLDSYLESRRALAERARALPSTKSP